MAFILGKQGSDQSAGELPRVQLERRSFPLGKVGVGGNLSPRSGVASKEALAQR